MAAEGESHTYSVLYDHPCGDYCLHVYRHEPKGFMPMFRSDDGVTIFAQGPFAGAPHGYDFLDRVCAAACAKQGKPAGIPDDKIAVIFTDEEIVALLH
jgi:hypothetical protein